MNFLWIDVLILVVVMFALPVLFICTAGSGKGERNEQKD